MSAFYSTLTFFFDLSKNVELCLLPIEPSAVVALPPTERKMSPPPKRSKPSSDEQMPSGASAMRPPCKGELFTHFSFVCLLLSVELTC